MAKFISFINTQALRFLHFVNHLNRNELALLSTFFSLGFLCLILLNLHLYPNPLKQEKGVEILVELKAEEIQQIQDNLQKKEETEPNDRSQNQDDFESNQSYNTQAQSTFSKNSFPPSEFSEQKNGSGNFEDKLKALAQKKQQALDSMEAIEGEYNNIPSKTRVYYSLFERTSESLPIPVYTCKQGGKVVVDIKVHPDGRVLDTQINTALSNTENGCLLENALRYALQSNFNVSEGKMQWGSITYYFQAK